MGGKSTKQKMDYILDVHWDITETPEKNLFIKLPNNIHSIYILCPIMVKDNKVEMLKLRANNTCNIIPYMSVFRGIYDIYKSYKYQIVRYAEDNDLPIKLFLKKLKFIENNNKIAYYKVILTD